MDIWFYHLTRQPLEKALPALLEKALERDWRVIVQTSAERLKPLDDALWTYAPEGFLPHSTIASDEAPIFLTAQYSPPDGAKLRIFVDGTEMDAALADDYARLILMFDGHDEAQLASARRQWSALKNSEHTLAYWQQTESGGWAKKA